MAEEQIREKDCAQKESQKSKDSQQITAHSVPRFVENLLMDDSSMIHVTL